MKLSSVSLNPENLKSLSPRFKTGFLSGSDSCAVSMFLYKDAYKIDFALDEEESVFLRFYSHSESQRGWAFPVSLSEKSEEECVKALLEMIISGKNGSFHKGDENLNYFCFMTEAQKKLFDKVLEENFPSYRIEWKTERAESDYIYLREKLALLKGSEMHKKKNHLNRFLKTFENRWNFKFFDFSGKSADEQYVTVNFLKDNGKAVLSDALKVEEQWLSSALSFCSSETERNQLFSERCMIENALKNAETLGISGSVLYVDENPCAMTIGSPVSEKILDVLFEKANGGYAENGAYAVINQMFASVQKEYEYFNREEDLGLEMLRKAKLSYKPEIILDKFNGKLLHN